MTDLRLPVDCDLCSLSLAKALTLLKEPPVRLRVSLDDNDFHQTGVTHIPLEVDLSIKRFGWILEGATRRVVVEG